MQEDWVKNCPNGSKTIKVILSAKQGNFYRFCKADNKVKGSKNPRPNRPNGDKIFRKVTPERSVASMGLLFVKKILLE
ncbi:hypothetical protein [Avibacterium volantium]|uniref:hypothetical protein n=1 Tax=Avibacterium TaxID=292486 RepID=UPI003BF900F8